MTWCRNRNLRIWEESGRTMPHSRTASSLAVITRPTLLTPSENSNRFVRYDFSWQEAELALPYYLIWMHVSTGVFSLMYFSLLNTESDLLDYFCQVLCCRKKKLKIVIFSPFLLLLKEGQCYMLLRMTLLSPFRMVRWMPSRLGNFFYILFFYILF